VLLPEKGPLFDTLKIGFPEERIIFYPNLYIFTRSSFKTKYLLKTSLQFASNVSKIIRIIRKHKIDIVHTNSGVVPAAAMAAKLSGRKHLWHIREWFGDFNKFWPLYAFYMRMLSDRIICVSETMATQFRERTKVKVIYNGFAVPDVGIPAIDTSLSDSLKTAELTLGCTSRIRLIRKGQEYLIEAVGILTKKSGKNIQIVLIGDYVPGYESQKLVLEKLIDKYGLRQRVHFLGHLTNPLPYYKLLDVFVLPSGEPEPFGGVVMEAMSMGLPVIGSNCGGTMEQINDGVNGYLFENQNSIDLAEKIENFLTDKKKIVDFGVHSKKRIEQLFSLELHAQKIIALYISL
jgi:glycosyltransferase involved in cell wall biosynthesis